MDLLQLADVYIVLFSWTVGTDKYVLLEYSSFDEKYLPYSLLFASLCLNSNIA